MILLFLNITLQSLPFGEIGGAVAQTGTSAREILEEFYVNTEFERTIIQDDVLRSELNDYDTIAYVADDSIIRDIDEFVENGEAVDKDDMLAYFYSDKGEYEKADSIAAYYATIEERHNEGVMIEVYNQLRQNGNDIYSLVADSALCARVLYVLNDSSAAGYIYALSIIQQLFGKVYHEPIYETDEEANKNMQITTKPETKIIKSAFLYPNPNNGMMQMDYKLNEGETGELTIMDITGRLIAKYNLSATETRLYVSQTELNNGMYFYQVTANNKIINSDKIIIIK